MNASKDGLGKTHHQIISLLRKAGADGNPLAKPLDDLDDRETARHLFANYRRGRGLRLTDLGLQLMKCYFRPYEVTTPPGYRIKPQHLLFLDKTTVLPYHYSNSCVILFELNLGTKLKLADGNIQTLIDMEKTNRSGG